MSGSACSGTWAWLWSTSGEETLATGDMVVGTMVTGEQVADGQPNLIENSVPYTGEAHEGTGIFYVGSGENRNKIIVIDAGHQKEGNSEKEPVGPGAEAEQAKVSWGTTGTYTGEAEYELNLQVALLLRDELLARGYSVVMVRETNEVNISNAERAQLANEYMADALVRIHANGWDDDTKQGAMMVCQTANNPYPDCAAVYPESRLLSDCILDAYCQSTGMAKLSVWETDTKAGTNWSQVPTTILEMGFMTNRQDDETMATDEFRTAAAKGIADGLDAYFAALTVLEDQEAQEDEALTEQP
jgi:N-acetylmuramoyl-L-alanine amidase